MVRLALCWVLLVSSPVLAQGTAATAPVGSLAVLRADLHGADPGDALDEIQRLGPRAAPLVSDVAPLLEAPEAVNAGFALGAIGKPALPVLRQALKSGNEDARQAAAVGLGQVGAAAAPAVQELAVCAASDTSDLARQWATEALGLIGKRPQFALPALKAALTDRSVDVAEAAHEALKRFPKGAPIRVQWLRARLRSPLPEHRMHAAVLAAASGWSDRPRVREGLVDALRRQRVSYGLRSRAISTLTHLRSKAVWALPILLETLRDTDESTRAAGCTALGNVAAGSKLHGAAIDALTRVLDDPNEGVVHAATFALLFLARPGHPETERKLAGLLTRPERYLVDAAQLALQALARRTLAAARAEALPAR